MKKRKLKKKLVINDWKYIDDVENLKAMPKDRDFEILFDNGSISYFDDENHPFAEIIAWREITQI